MLAVRSVEGCNEGCTVGNDVGCLDGLGSPLEIFVGRNDGLLVVESEERAVGRTEGAVRNIMFVLIVITVVERKCNVCIIVISSRKKILCLYYSSMPKEYTKRMQPINIQHKTIYFNTRLSIFNTRLFCNQPTPSISTKRIQPINVVSKSSQDYLFHFSTMLM